MLVWAEQGFGDAMQFLRFVPELKRRGGRVVLEVLGEMMRARLRTLGSASAPTRQWVAWSRASTPCCRARCSSATSMRSDGVQRI